MDRLVRLGNKLMYRAAATPCRTRTDALGNSAAFAMVPDLTRDRMLADLERFVAACRAERGAHMNDVILST